MAIVDNDCLKPSDAIILLEGDGFYRLKKAVDLYKKGYGKKIVFSGAILQKEYGIEQISVPSLLLLTKTVTNYIEELVHRIRNTTELAEREESNIIDNLFTLLLKNNKNQKTL